MEFLKTFYTSFLSIDIIFLTFIIEPLLIQIKHVNPVEDSGKGDGFRVQVFSCYYAFFMRQKADGFACEKPHKIGNEKDYRSFAIRQSIFTFKTHAYENDSKRRN